MQLGEGHDLGEPGHRAVGIGQFAQDAVGRQPRKAHEIHAGFGVPGALAHAAGSRAQGEHVAGVVQVAGDGIVGDGCADGLHAVGGGDAGGDALGGLNGNGEGRAVLACVVCDHLRQVELADLVFRQAEADDAAAFADEQGHLLVGDGGGGEDDVAFVFSVLVVHDKDAPAFADGGDGGFYALIAGGGELMLAHGALQRVGCAASGRQTGAPRHNAAARELCMLRLSRRVNAPAVHFSFIRTVTVGSGFPPDLLTPPRGGRSRALPESGNTAGGDFHPALRIAGV